MSKRKVLVFIDWYLPGFKAGGPIRSCANLVEHLSDEFEFLIVTRNTDYTDSVPYPSIQSDTWVRREDGSSVYYFSEEKLNRKNIRNLIRGTDFDAVYLNGIYSVYFTLYPLVYLRKKSDKQVVVAVRGMLAESAIQIKKGKKQFFLRAVKVLRLFNSVVFHATTAHEEMDIVAQFGSDAKVVVAGNLAAKQNIAVNPPRIKQEGKLSLVSIARVSPEKNLLYALQLLEGIKNVEIDFDIYGPVYDENYWAECKKVIAGLPVNIRVEYAGSLESEKVAMILSKYHFLFMPTTGENFGHVILQALSAGCALLISDKTPWRNLEARRCGWDLPLEKPGYFQTALQACARLNQAEFNLLSGNAFAFAQQYLHDPKTALENRRLFRKD
ncbi:MAG TPA: glycosyltransferase family 4 protein [Bacteroidia bacterium]|jgi:glycosyltransferase involved in cell wall biosynthesis|nr:glycosyltransferase family 4 protein [Bacteroidia bacterium]